MSTRPRRSRFPRVPPPTPCLSGSCFLLFTAWCCCDRGRPGHGGEADQPVIEVCDAVTSLRLWPKNTRLTIALRLNRPQLRFQLSLRLLRPWTVAPPSVILPPPAMLPPIRPAPPLSPRAPSPWWAAPIRAAAPPVAPVPPVAPPLPLRWPVPVAGLRLSAPSRPRPLGRRRLPFLGLRGLGLRQLFCFAVGFGPGFLLPHPLAQRADLLLR